MIDHIKRLFIDIFYLLGVPNKGWRLIKQRYRNRYDLKQLIIYPALSVFLILVFLNALLSEGFSGIPLTLMYAIRMCIVSIIGLYLSDKFIPKIARKMGIKASLYDWQLFIRYALSPLYIMILVLILSQTFIVAYLLIIYVAYIIWDGLESFFGINDNRRQLVMTVIMYLVIILNITIPNWLIIRLVDLFN